MTRPHKPNVATRLIMSGFMMLTVMLATTSCGRLAPHRTLPSWVRGIYIPMIENQTHEPGIETLATRLTQEAFLLDGRVDVVGEDDADLVLKITIDRWESQTSGTSGDKIATSDRITVGAGARLYRHIKDLEPVADLGSITQSEPFMVDTRSSSFVPEPRRRELLLEKLAEEIVHQTVSGFPD